MASCLNENFLKMCGGFVTIIIFALVWFYLLDYLSRDAELQSIVASIFSSLIK